MSKLIPARQLGEAQKNDGASTSSELSVVIEEIMEDILRNGLQ